MKDLVSIFKLLADETRLRILLHLSRQDELHVRGLCELLQQSQPAVSHHLALLRGEGLIELRREGKHNYYHLAPKRFQRMLDTVFETVPSEDHTIRFVDYMLTRPVEGPLAERRTVK
jgi:ArsR family transcriptional regulator